MIYKTTSIQGTEKRFHELENIMKLLGFDRWTWDYEKVVYDKKYVIGEHTYYLRVQGNVINDKPLENPKALLQMKDPVFAEHFFPHGLDNEVEVPNELSDEINAVLAKVEKALHG